ncbi:hypothetical protein ALP12_200040 [Pseudomonas savastanoi pv. phaseolicola]|nr:Rhs element Vgr protein [Pseudomonas savastanoi pv. phaseolicola]RMV27859.1 hypothetical protein ALP12_200040 [Pseudomonas savastanoi pv. phaseolicola]
MNSILDAAINTFSGPLSQAGRLLELNTPQGQELFALRAHVVERLSHVARYTVDVINQTTDFDPEKLIGQAVQLSIRLDDGSLRSPDIRHHKKPARKRGYLSNWIT